MATTSIDTSELEYLKSCRNKIRGMAEILDEKIVKQGQKKSTEEKLQEIKKIFEN